MATSNPRHGVTISGIPVRLHPSLLLIAGLAVWGTSNQLRPIAGSMLLAIVLGVVATIGMFASILWHELAHARQGRRHHLHVHGVTLFVFGGVTAMDDEIRAPGDEFRIAIVGPWVSMQLAAIFGLVTAGLDWMGWLAPVAAVLGLLGWFNVSLAVFNLLPGAPLDGGRVLQAALWRMLGDRRRAARLSALFGILLGVGIWGLSGWLVLRNPDALWSALWLTAVAAFIVVLAVRQWRVWQTPAPAHDPPPDPPPYRRTGWEWTGLVASTLLVLLAFAIVPMPVIELSPGPVLDAAADIHVSGPTTEVHGEALVLTAIIWHPGMAELLRAALDDERRIVPRAQVIPDGVGDRSYFGQQRDTFATSFDQAAAAGLRAAGEQVDTTVEVVVRTILPGAPADGVVESGDVILAADGVTLASVEQLSQTTAGKEVGDTLELEVDRQGEIVDLSVPIALLPGGERTGVGITLGTVVTRMELPREITTDATGIGGPSAGLVTALVINDLVSPVDLLGGRIVAATATIDEDGRVGRVGSIREKVLGAIANDAELLLVHESQVTEALAAADGQLEVAGVTTLDEAIARLSP